jgi:hypothetical protein
MESSERRKVRTKAMLWKAPPERRTTFVPPHEELELGIFYEADALYVDGLQNTGENEYISIPLHAIAAAIAEGTSARAGLE